MQGGNSCYFVTCIWKTWEHLSLAGSAYCYWFSRAPGGLTNPERPHAGQLNAVEITVSVKKTQNLKPKKPTTKQPTPPTKKPTKQKKPNKKTIHNQKKSPQNPTKPTRKDFLWESCKRKPSLFKSQQQGNCSAELGLSRLPLLTPYTHTHKNFKNSYMPENRHTNKTYLNFGVTTLSSKNSRDATDFHIYTDRF